MKTKGKFDGIIILSDLDGTLLDRHSRVCERNREAIEYFKREGGAFTFNTGRQHSRIVKMVPDAVELVNAPISCTNGAYLYDMEKKRTIFEQCMEKSLSSELVRLARRELPSVYIEISTPRGVFVPKGDSFALEDHPDDAGLDGQSFTLDEVAGENWYKIVCADNADKLVALREKVVAKYGSAFEYFNSAPTCFEVCGAGVDKGSVVGFLKNYLAPDGNAVLYAIGDYENDIPMLRRADVAACPSNALDSVKALCTIHVCSHDDGALAGLIERI